ncbi:hypothetical protein E3P81_02600 [Wallemia ichthyophaga]|nr:hypothetical protein E3P97_02671 [Wallemia ichthyophaga]TIB31263.1 hypothetical protein E3P85_02324 [Wallemia ichthyophaga]TIB45747.1 hypothetical protein E3P82_02599 [Wallemia ichthyophaga]TIB49174.1 hypothetical protein E3P81_02600 [Wallemia ichthyophaga]TIB52339.1 hypothetical protein E3P80_02601 [Wallemia ichthyophaga]
MPFNQFLQASAHFHASHLAPVIAFFSASQNESTRLSHPQIQPRRDLIAVFVASYLAYSGLKKRSLSLSGAISAFIVGYASLSSTICSFGVMLIVFYLSGSKATKVRLCIFLESSTQLNSNKVKHYVKAQLEDGHDSEKPGGVRNWLQVLANSYTGAICAIIYRVQHVIITPADITDTSECILHSSVYISSQTLLLMALGHYACCSADTLASELGILSGNFPRLVTNPSKTVPPGTNGGVSSFGVVVSGAGGLLIGLTAVISLAIEDSSCFGQNFSFGQALISFTSAKLLLLSVFSGLFGSLLDSLIGATLQRTLLHKERGKILTDGSDPAFARMYDEARRSKSKETAEVKLISGFNLFSNTQVNFFSSLFTALLTAVIGNLLL